MDIRNYKTTDIPEISRLYFNTVHRINSRDYTPEQIRAWVPTVHNNTFWSERFQKRQVLVAEDKNKIVGFAEYETSGHIDCFYVHHEHQRKRIGTALMQRIEDELGKLYVHRLYAEVSLTARTFFANKGFQIVEERNSEYRDIIFKLILMEKYINVSKSNQSTVDKA